MEELLGNYDSTYEAEAYDLQYGFKRDDIPFWAGLAQEYAGNGGHVLELGCGTGRVLIPVAESGVRVTGIDVSSLMLGRARARCNRLPAEVQSRILLLEGDMRSFESAQKFNLVYIPFNSFLLMQTVAEQLAVFETARRVLAPGGAFALDIFVPDLKRLADRRGTSEWQVESDQTLGDLGIRLQRESKVVYSLAGQQVHATFRHRIYIDDSVQREWVDEREFSYLFPRELEHLAARTGFELTHLWGDYDRKDFAAIPAPDKLLPVMQAV